ncbi:MAG TPA: helix-hairpin-helix domain-containing protein [Phycisphaerales bacterium]|nr:helix-hairpin-helix domain-containing protein [Phycisphaerales bacterium]
MATPPAKPSGQTAGATPPPVQRATHAPVLAGAAKWGAIAVLGATAVVAVAWVIVTNRTRPTIAGTATPALAVPSSAEGPAPKAGSVLDINTATAAQLEHLPGIGPAIAARIVADRARHGPYSTVEQLDRVEGIGPKTLQKLRPYITVN